MAPISRNSTELPILKCLFSESLLILLVQCTNKRMALLKVKGSRNITHTYITEIKIVLGISLIIDFLRSNYWSKNESMGNEFAKRAIAQNRYQNLMSKLYFNFHEQPQWASKL